MNVVSSMQERIGDASLETARVTQAMAIEGFDCLTRGLVGVVRALPKPASPDPERMAFYISKEAQLVDRQYVVLGRLLDLHREFAQRLFDVLGARETKDTMTDDSALSADVVPLQSARGRQRRR